MFLSVFKKLKKATPEDDRRLAKALTENRVGAKDVFAMLLSGFLVILLPCLLVLCGLCAVAFVLLGIF